MADNTICTQCGMHTQPKEYHPYAACLMFLACKNERVVRGNLKDVVAYNDKRLRDGIRALADKWEKDANSLRDGKTVQAHAEADTLQDCAGFARALLDGE